MKGKVVLVTGGTRGIGLSVAQAFGAAGARVAVTRDGSRASEARPAGLPGAWVVPGDADTEGERMVMAVIGRLGRLDVLVNAAGLGGSWGRSRRLEAIRSRDWARAMETSLWGPFVCSRAAARVMKRGSIVNVARVSSLTGAGGELLEVASGAGVLGLTRGLAVALAPRIRVNCMALEALGRVPGSSGDLPGRGAGGKALPVGRRGTPEEVGALALFLAENPYVTGQTVVLDGGEARV